MRTYVPWWLDGPKVAKAEKATKGGSREAIIVDY
jgi:hypothetical protein